MAIFFLAVLCVPAFASDSGSLSSPLSGDFWTWVQYSNNWFKSIFDEDICPQSPNTNGRHELVKTHTTVDGKTGYFYVCKHCGKSAGEVGEGAYQEQVSTLPASGYSSDGSLLWSPVIECLWCQYYTNSSGRTTYYSSGCSHYVRPSDHKESETPAIFDCEYSIITITARSGSSYTKSGVPYFKCAGVFPVDGLYAMQNSAKMVGYYINYTGPRVDVNLSYSESAPVVYSSGDLYLNEFNYASQPWYSVFSVQCFAPVFKVTPTVALSGDIYNTNTRPTTITGGNYGIVGDDNNITTVTNTTQIVNEGDNLYYNPATGQTQTITDWTYNYDGRIYNITLDTGDTVSVEYGDENITIVENTTNEGDTIVNNYTIYYMIDGSGSGETHTHEWYKTGERQATCLVPAQRTYTCSICGEQKTETDPVLGHSWRAIQTVTTQYDDDGNQIQEGYTIYECERCGEQYKSTNNTGPPPTGGGSSGGGTSENIFTGIFGLIWDFFTFLFDLFSEFVVGGIKGFISGLKDAGSSFFSILNPFDWGY